MKKFLILFFVTTVHSLIAQTSVYHPFPINNGSWNYQYYDDFHNPTGLFNSYVLSGDTIISGINYKKINGGALRESNKIIYFYPYNGSQEYVLYNFNLNAGDSIIHPYGGTIFGNHDTLIVGSLDSTLTRDGYHRRLNFLPTYTVWIEGIGSLNHLLRPSFWYNLSGDSYLECMVGDTGIISPLVPFNSSYCIATSVREQAISKNSILISPNPFHSSAILNLDDHFKNAELTIYDGLGKQVKRQKLIVKETTVNRDGLPSGIFFFQVINDTGQVATGKFIIE